MGGGWDGERACTTVILMYLALAVDEGGAEDDALPVRKPEEKEKEVER